MRHLFFLIIFIIYNTSSMQPANPEKIRKLAKYGREIQQLEQANFSRRFIQPHKKPSMFSQVVDQIYYDLDFAITTSPKTFVGKVTGIFRNQVSELEKFDLNFDSREGIGYWNNFNVTGNVNGFTHSNWILTIELDRTYNAGEFFSVTVEYEGIPRSSGFKGFEFDVNRYGDPVISTLSEPYLAQTWWPCKDDPSDKLDSASITVTVPDNMVVASNGLLESEILNPNSSRTFVWKEKYPITTYLISLAISNYTAFSDSFEYSPGNFMPIDYFVYPQQLNAATSAFAPLPDMLASYSKQFGLYPFVNEKYGHAVFEWGGAMEHQTCTSIGAVSEDLEAVYAHELAHQWFGNLVTCHDWHQIWMNEGFATYSEALWVEDAYGKEAYHEYIDYSLSSLGSWANDAIYRYEIDNPWYIFHQTVYIKGMWVLHMLRHIVGESVFLRILRDYPNDPEFAFKTTTTEQFRDFCEQLSEMQLDWFFDQWIYEPYYPRYAWDYEYFAENNRDSLLLTIQQNQYKEGYDHLYRMPIDFHIQYKNGLQDTLTIFDSLLTQRYLFEISGEPEEIFFDPENWILKIATRKTGVDITSPLAGFCLYQNYPNPFNHITRIPYAIGYSGYVRLDIYDLTGRKIRTMLNEKAARGDILVWNGVDDYGRPVASGIYIYRLRFDGKELSRKMVLIR